MALGCEIPCGLTGSEVCITGISAWKYQRLGFLRYHLCLGLSMEKTPEIYCLAANKTYCNYCPGYCCYRLEGATLYLDGDDINRIARHFNVADGVVRQRYLEGRNTFKVREDGSCIFLSNNKMRARCMIHTARPRQCREFPYDKPCPYLESDYLLKTIQPRIEKYIVARFNCDCKS